MAKPKKIHRAGSSGLPMCGKVRKDGPVITHDNEKVTCGLCHHSMHGSWGIPLPPGLSTRRGGRPTHSRANRRASMLKKAAEHRAKAEALEQEAKALEEDDATDT